MEKIIKTAFLYVKIFFKQYFVSPFIAAILLTLALTIILLIIQKHTKRQINMSTPKIFFVFISFMYFCELFYITLFYRVGIHNDALSDVFGEWTIFDGETSMYLNLRPILNIVLFIPFSIIIFSFFNKILQKSFTGKKEVLYSIPLSFLLSMFIELVQLIFSLGTFQLSDLTYNTVGGLIGALIYISARKFISNKKLRVHK